MSVNCIICSKKLKNPISISRGTGKICANNIRDFFNKIKNKNYSKVIIDFQNDEILEELAISNARSEFLAKIHKKKEIPVAEGKVGKVVSITRQTYEDLEYEKFSNGAVITHSRSGNISIIN